MGGMWALAVLFSVGAPEPAADAAGFLWPAGAGGPIRYAPREGDLVLYSRRDLPMVIFYGFARIGHPHHCGLVVALDDAGVAVLESGATVVPGQRVALLDVPGRFCGHVRDVPDGVIWVRRVRRPLTPEESARLTAFACAQLGKPFAPYLRLALLALPGRLGRPSRPDQCNWYCSELAAAALYAAGLWPAGEPPGEVAPADLFFDDIDLSRLWEPPARWTPCPCPPAGLPRFFPRQWLSAGR
jgi:hypothetical protein